MEKCMEFRWRNVWNLDGEMYGIVEKRRIN